MRIVAIATSTTLLSFFAACSGKTTSSSFRGDTNRINKSAAPSQEDVVVAGDAEQVGVTPNEPGTTTEEPTQTTIIEPTPTPNPCAEAQAAAGDASVDSKILFFAPANYHYGVNRYAQAVAEHLKNNKFDIKLIDKVEDMQTFDECSLYLSFKQIWLFLPCNNMQTMDNNSFEAVKKYYSYGGGLTMLTDQHFFTNNQPNTHCNATNWAGSADKPSDATRVARDILQVPVHFASTWNAGNGINANTTHPLSTALTDLSGNVGSWRSIQMDLANTSNKDFQLLADPKTDQTKVAPWFGLIEANRKDATGGTIRRLGVLLTPMYNYHGSPAAGQLSFYGKLAVYFENNVKTVQNKVAGGPGALALAGSLKRTLTYPIAISRASIASLRTQLKRSDKHDIVDSLTELARRGEIPPEEIIKYFENESFYVRANAVAAIFDYPDTEKTAKALHTELIAPQKSDHMLMGIARSLAALHLIDEGEALHKCFEKAEGTAAKREIILALGALKYSPASKTIKMILSKGDAPQDLVDAAKETLKKLVVLPDGD